MAWCKSDGFDNPDLHTCSCFYNRVYLSHVTYLQFDTSSRPRCSHGDTSTGNYRSGGRTDSRRWCRSCSLDCMAGLKQKVKVNVSSYIAQFPVLTTAQSCALYSTVDLFNRTPFRRLWQATQQSRRENDFRHIITIMMMIFSSFSWTPSRSLMIFYSVPLCCCRVWAT